jgi:hypothetical protein
MMLRDIDEFFWNKPEPAKSCLAALRNLILQFDPDMVELWRYGMPFYNWRGRRICYLWIEKKTGRPYIGIVDGNLLQHPELLAEKRSRMKILPVNPYEDLPAETIAEVLTMAVGRA